MDFGSEADGARRPQQQQQRKRKRSSEPDHHQHQQPEGGDDVDSGFDDEVHPPLAAAASWNVVKRAREAREGDSGPPIVATRNKRRTSLQLPRDEERLKRSRLGPAQPPPPLAPAAQQAFWFRVPKAGGRRELQEGKIEAQLVERQAHQRRRFELHLGREQVRSALPWGNYSPAYSFASAPSPGAASAPGGFAPVAFSSDPQPPDTGGGGMNQLLSELHAQRTARRGGARGSSPLDPPRAGATAAPGGREPSMDES